MVNGYDLAGIGCARCNKKRGMVEDLLGVVVVAALDRIWRRKCLLVGQVWSVRVGLVRFVKFVEWREEVSESVSD